MEDKKQSKASIILDGVCGLIMVVCTLVYLLIGFIAKIWQPTWVVFVIGGFVCAIIGIIKDTILKVKAQDQQKPFEQ